MKIVISITSFVRGGAERVVANLANKLVNDGHQVTIAFYKKSEIGYPLDDKINVITDSEKCKTAFGHILFRRNLFKNSGFDIVISFLDQLSMINIPAMFGLSIPLIVANRNDPRVSPKKEYLRWIRNFLFQFADHIIVQNQHNLNYFSEKIRKKSTIIYNAVNMNGYEKKALCTPKKDKIVWIGRLTEQKNPFMMLKAFYIFHKKHPTYKLHIYGDGILKNDLIKFTQKYNLSDFVIFEGNMPDIYEQIKDSRLFVMTSNFEGMPNALLEAMCIGLPVICTKVAGATDVIQNQKNGILIDCNDVKSLFQSMEFILSDDAIQKKYAEKASELYKYLKSDIIATQWIQVINQVVFERKTI